MLPDRLLNPGPLTYESGALPISLRGPARYCHYIVMGISAVSLDNLLFDFLTF